MKITFRRFYFLNFLSPLLLELSEFPGPNLWVFAKFNNSLPKAETNSKFEVICNRLLYLLGQQKRIFLMLILYRTKIYCNSFTLIIYYDCSKVVTL